MADHLAHPMAAMRLVGYLGEIGEVYWAEPGRFERPGFQVWNPHTKTHDWYALCADDPANILPDILPMSADLEPVLSEAAATFREYERHHRAKINEPGRAEKMARNRRMAELIEGLLLGLVAPPPELSRPAHGGYPDVQQPSQIMANAERILSRDATEEDASWADIQRKRNVRRHQLTESLSDHAVYPAPAGNTLFERMREAQKQDEPKRIAPLEVPKPIICLDFDGVIHSYEKGWQGGEIYGTATRGFFAWGVEAMKHFDLVVYSSRSKTSRGRIEMEGSIANWICAEVANGTIPEVDGQDLFAALKFTDTKPPAFLNIDDRAICFTGSWADLAPEKLLAFKTWTQVPAREDTFISRLRQEHDELEARYTKLHNFMDSEKFDGVTRFQRDMLLIQREAMRIYLQALSDRLTDFRLMDAEPEAEANYAANCTYATCVRPLDCPGRGRCLCPRHSD